MVLKCYIRENLSFILNCRWFNNLSSSGRRSYIVSRNPHRVFSLSVFCVAVTHEHLKDRALFGFPPPPPGANPSEYYHLMASASQRSPYGDLLMQNGAAAAAAAAAAAHLPDYISPVDGENSTPPNTTRESDSVQVQIQKSLQNM